MAPWVYNPHTGGKKIPDAIKDRIRTRILAHAAKHYAGKYERIDVRFRNALCYVEAYCEPVLEAGPPPPVGSEIRDEAIERMRNTPMHLCRLRFFGDENRWSVAFYTYSHDKYEPCVFHSGDDHGTPEEGFDVGAIYLQG